MVEYIKDSSIHSTITTINGKVGQISLFQDTIIFNYKFQTENDVHKIIISDIINISNTYGFSLKNRLIQYPKLITKSSVDQDRLKMIIYSVKSRPKRNHQLDILLTIIHFDNEQYCEEWHNLIRQMLDRDESRPRSLTVFINPIGGFKKGVQMYNEKVSPIFELAGIKCNVTITKNSCEAEEYILKQEILDVDGFVCVGGDGMFMELVQGLLLRARQDSGYSESEHGLYSKEFPAPSRVGIIPAGSTDTVAFSTTGTKDPITAALNIVLGKSIGIDVISVHCDNLFIRYNVSLMGYGFYGNLVAESESLRWMGPRRYDWLGFKNFMSLEAYYGELTYSPVSVEYGEPNDGVFCSEKCSRCAEDPNIIHSDNASKVTIRDRFVAINSFLLSCRCTKSPIGPAPYAHLGNGCTDLVIVRECSRLKFLQHLIRTASYEDHFDFDFVETVRVSEFSFVPLPDVKSANSNIDEKLQYEGMPWNSDGEPIYIPKVRCRVHRQIIKVFATGISHNSVLNRPIKSNVNESEKKINSSKVN